MSHETLPVIVGVGQVVDAWDGTGDPAAAPSPLSLMVTASQAALRDMGVAMDPATIDTIAAVRTNEDSIPKHPHPNGLNANLPGTLARDLGARPKRAIYSSTGGQTPQSLINEMAGRIQTGEVEVALIAGSEANRAAKGARRQGVKINWTDDADLAVDDRTMGPMLLNRTEIKHGLVSPPYFYALFENAIAAKRGHTRSQHRAAMSALFAPFSTAAAANPYAQFPIAHTADFLATPSAENYPVADPFLKWHVAQDAVNQGACVIMMSQARADALGIARNKRVYLHGGGEAYDGMISERDTLTRSRAMTAALSTALDQAEMTASEIDIFDLYSCFPCAVFSSTSALGIDPVTDTRPLTTTGGLPYFGGPGNNYSLHGIASMTERLRAAPGTFGLVLANGGWMTKEAAGVYSTRPPATFKSVPEASGPNPPIEIETDPKTGQLETFTIIHKRGGTEISHGVGFCRTQAGKRFIAFADGPALDILSREESAIGAPITATRESEVNTFHFAGA